MIVGVGSWVGAGVKVGVAVGKLSAVDLIILAARACAVAMIIRFCTSSLSILASAVAVTSIVGEGTRVGVLVGVGILVLHPVYISTRVTVIDNRKNLVYFFNEE